MNIHEEKDGNINDNIYTENQPMETMIFPEEEYESIKGFLKGEMGYCKTTRVFKELGKYKIGRRYNTDFGSNVEILEIERYKKLLDHPYYEYLTPEQISIIAKYSEDIGEEYEVIKFKEVL